MTHQVVWLFVVASTIGAALVFPGSSSLEFGTLLDAPPFLTGLGPIFLTWMTAPLLSITFVSLASIGMRNILFRGEDPFTKSCG